MESDIGKWERKRVQPIWLRCVTGRFERVLAACVVGPVDVRVALHTTFAYVPPLVICVIERDLLVLDSVEPADVFARPGSLPDLQSDVVVHEVRYLRAERPVHAHRDRDL